MFYFFAGLVLIAMGVTMLVNPRLIFKLTESWKHDGVAEPSEMFLLSTRFGGVMCTLAGICGLVAAFIPQ